MNETVKSNSKLILKFGYYIEVNNLIEWFVFFIYEKNNKNLLHDSNRKFMRLFQFLTKWRSQNSFWINLNESSGYQSKMTFLYQHELILLKTVTKIMCYFSSFPLPFFSFLKNLVIKPSSGTKQKGKELGKEGTWSAGPG